MKNYRKSKKGEICCEKCQHSQDNLFGGRLRCVLGCYITARGGEGFSAAVSKSGTCDEAEAKEKAGVMAEGCEPLMASDFVEKAGVKG